MGSWMRGKTFNSIRKATLCSWLLWFLRFMDRPAGRVGSGPKTAQISGSDRVGLRFFRVWSGRKIWTRVQLCYRGYLYSNWFSTDRHDFNTWPSPQSNRLRSQTDHSVKNSTRLREGPGRAKANTLYTIKSHTFRPTYSQRHKNRVTAMNLFKLINNHLATVTSFCQIVRLLYVRLCVAWNAYLYGTGLLAQQRNSAGGRERWRGLIASAIQAELTCYILDLLCPLIRQWLGLGLCRPWQWKLV